MYELTVFVLMQFLASRVCLLYSVSFSRIILCVSRAQVGLVYIVRRLLSTPFFHVFFVFIIPLSANPNYFIPSSSYIRLFNPLSPLQALCVKQRFADYRTIFLKTFFFIRSSQGVLPSNSTRILFLLSFITLTLFCVLSMLFYLLNPVFDRIRTTTISRK